MEIRSLENIGFDTLFEGFSNAFSDYEIHFDKSVTLILIYYFTGSEQYWRRPQRAQCSPRHTLSN